MRTLTLLMIGLFLSLKISAQSTIVTTTISVKGNCGECKERIENAADIKGVKLCKWDKETKIASIKYDSKKTNLETIEKSIAKAGYQTQSQKADAGAYAKLPKCCQYEGGECTEKK
ncbi:MAG: heavy-metal-associated domain-containing protein [Bacteroidia bacterium]|jgi:periplasmic mercuric ion binding protein|nr:heavy-metal-associated domain-containing protein [Bacteroidia bacterium]